VSESPFGSAFGGVTVLVPSPDMHASLLAGIREWQTSNRERHACLLYRRARVRRCLTRRHSTCLAMSNTVR